MLFVDCLLFAPCLLFSYSHRVMIIEAAVKKKRTNRKTHTSTKTHRPSSLFTRTIGLPHFSMSTTPPLCIVWANCKKLPKRSGLGETSTVAMPLRCVSLFFFYALFVVRFIIIFIFHIMPTFSFFFFFYRYLFC